MSHGPPALLSSEELTSLLEVSKGDAQCDIPQLHWERLVALGYAIRRLGVLGETEAGLRRLAARNNHSEIRACSPEPQRIQDIEANWRPAGKDAGRKSKRGAAGPAGICRGSPRTSCLDRRWHDANCDGQMSCREPWGFVESDHT